MKDKKDQKPVKIDKEAIKREHELKQKALQSNQTIKK